MKKTHYEVHDATTYSTADDAIRVSEMRYRRLFEAAKDGVLILDADTGQIIDVNPFLIEKLGYTKEEFVTRKVWEIGTVADIEINKSKFKELQENGFVHYDSMPLLAKEGTLVDVEFVSNCYLVDRQKMMQCNIRDITERRKVENQLRESEHKLMEQNILLEQKNAALREIMIQNRDEKERIEKQVQGNIDYLLKPVIENLKGKGSALADQYITLWSQISRRLPQALAMIFRQKCSALPKKRSPSAT